MLLTIALVLILLWLLGFVIVPIGGGAIHILLVVALVILVVRLLQGRRIQDL